jgi:integrase
MRFTDKQLKGLASKASAYRLYEKGVDKGFGIKVTPSGHKSFFQQYTYAGKVRFAGIGSYPEISLADAREKARELRSLVERGIDPQEERQKEPEKLKDGTVKQLFDYYIDKMKAQGKRSWPEVKRVLDANAVPFIGDLQASEIKPYHIRDLMHRMIERGSETQANRLRSYLHTAFKIGVHHDNDPKSLKSGFMFNLTHNPVADVPRDPSAERIGERVLTMDEIVHIWTYDGPAITPHMVLAIRLIIATGGQRPAEITDAALSEIDLDKGVWSIPPERIKNKRWHLIPITKLCDSVLRETIALAGYSPYLFPNRNKPKDLPMKSTSLPHAVEKFCERTGCEKFTAKDLRRTIKTHMGEIGISKDVRDRIQNHALTDVSSKHYDRYDYLPEKRKGLMEWESYLVERLSR